jgi:hypothetical protein
MIKLPHAPVTNSIVRFVFIGTNNITAATDFIFYNQYNIQKNLRCL